MSSGEQQLTADFEQVKQLLESYPNIRIIKTEGDPPEQYDVEYTIKGYKTNPDGTATPDDKHEVRITLPFGYPHFPPTAKPITPIYHPDIDPDAIRIADFWQENHSLPELIIHIGQMICGKHYTTEEPFNQSAFEWFEERKSWLPFDILEPQDEDEKGEDTEASDSEALDAEISKAFAPATDLDILKDDIDFPFEEEDDPFSFDESEISNETDDEISFAFDKSTEVEELEEIEVDDPADEFSLDFEEEETSESLDLGGLEADEAEDIFSIDEEDIPDEFSFDLEEKSDEIETSDEQQPGELFDLDTEQDTSGAEQESPLEFDAADITSAFEEETADISEKSDTLDITLDDLGDLDSDEGELDFGIADESDEFTDDVHVDLSDLKDEQEPVEPVPDETKILSALSLDEEFTSAEKLEEKSQAIRALIEQKQIFSAKKVLTDLPDADSLPNKTELELTISDSVEEAEDLYKKADKHEQSGELEKAGILLDLVANIATDFPGLDFARNRIRESMMADHQKKPDDTSVSEDTQVQGDTAETSKEKPVVKKKTKKKLGFKIPAKLIIFLLVIVILGGLGAGGAYVYINDSEKMQLATKAFKRVEQLVDNKEFKAAKNRLDTVTADLEKVIFFQKTEKEALLAKIAGITNSNVYREGLKGRVLYGDQYVSIETAKAIDKYTTHKEFAEKVLTAGKIEQAISAYEKALPYAENAKIDKQADSTRRKISELRLEMALAQAKQFASDQNWLDAEKLYNKAFELSKDVASPEERQVIADQRATASYRYGLNEGLKAINDSQWQDAITSFETMQKVLKESPHIIQDTERVEIAKLLVQSRLFFSLAEAKKAYEIKEWERAIDTYQSSITLLENNRNLLGQEAATDIAKIKKTILTTRVSREQDQVAATRSQNKLKQTVTHYESIVTLIEKSDFSQDEILAAILEDARKQTVELKNQLLINDKEKWLTDNFDKIFRDNYPSAESSELMNPEVRFIKREADIMVFNISCTERKQGSKFRLELNYQHNLAKGDWGLYSGAIDE